MLTNWALEPPSFHSLANCRGRRGKRSLAVGRGATFGKDRTGPLNAVHHRPTPGRTDCPVENTAVGWICEYVSMRVWDQETDGYRTYGFAVSGGLAPGSWLLFSHSMILGISECGALMGERF